MFISTLQFLSMMLDSVRLKGSGFVAGWSQFSSMFFLVFEVAQLDWPMNVPASILSTTGVVSDLDTLTFLDFIGS